MLIGMHLKEIYGMASLELARAAVIARDEYGLPVVGFDLAGEGRVTPQAIMPPLLSTPTSIF